MGMLGSAKKKNQEPIAYECDECGSKTTAYGAITRCLGCGKKLCEVCNHYMLCAKDFNNLEKRDQKKVKRANSGLENAKTSKRIFTIMPIVMGGIGFTLLLLMFILQRDMLYFLFGFLGGFLLLCALMFWVVFHNIEKQETNRALRQIKDILLPYNIRRATPGPTKIEAIHCPNCNGNITSDAKICEWCGSTLKETPDY